MTEIETIEVEETDGITSTVKAYALLGLAAVGAFVCLKKTANVVINVVTRNK